MKLLRCRRCAYVCACACACVRVCVCAYVGVCVSGQHKKYGVRTQTSTQPVAHGHTHTHAHTTHARNRAHKLPQPNLTVGGIKPPAVPKNRPDHRHCLISRSVCGCVLSTNMQPHVHTSPGQGELAKHTRSTYAIAAC